jgi:uracil-DNA glycosylase
MNPPGDPTTAEPSSDLLARVQACTVCAANLPHPSPRNRLWLKRHPWFEADVLPELRERLGTLLPAGDNGGAPITSQ